MRTYLENYAENPEVEIEEMFGDEGVVVEPVAAGAAAAVGRRDDTLHRVDRRAEDDGRRDDGDDGDARATQRADARADRRVADGEVAEHGQRHGQPHGDRVRRDVEAVVEEQVVDPGGRVSAGRVGARVAVEVGGVGNVEDHREQVGDGESRQQDVGGRSPPMHTRSSCVTSGGVNCPYTNESSFDAVPPKDTEYTSFWGRSSQQTK